MEIFFKKETSHSDTTDILHLLAYFWYIIKESYLIISAFLMYRNTEIWIKAKYFYHRINIAKSFFHSQTSWNKIENHRRYFEENFRKNNLTIKM